MSQVTAKGVRKSGNASLRRLSLTTALGSLAAMSYGRSAYAGGCTGTGGTYLCTGAADPVTDGEILITRDGPVEVTTEDGFGVDVSRIAGASAIELQPEYGASFTTGNDVLILADDGTSGFDYGVGLDVFNLFGGNVVVDTTGAEVRGAAGIAIESFSFLGSYAGSANIFVTSGSASSTTGGSAIYALQVSNAGRGTDITIDTTAGKIISTGSEGVTARGRAAAEDGTANIRITTGDVDAAGAGISAVKDAFFSSADGFDGSSITIDSRAGSVASSYGSGIYVLHEGLSSGGAANVAVTTANVSGGSNGIEVETNASGYRSANLAIDTSGGMITGKSASGIVAAHTGVSDYGTAELSITTADVTGGTDGIFALSTSEASESTTLAIDTSAGSVMGKTGLGIEARHYAQSAYGAARLAITTADVTGGTTGIFALNNAYAYAINDLVIDTVAGSVTGESDAGIVAVQDGESDDSDTDLLITTADVTGATDGIYALNLGNAYGTSDLVIDTAAGSVVGQSGRGIEARHAGYSYSETADLIITTADVTGGIDGIYATSEGDAYGPSDLIIDTSAGSVVGQTARGIDARHTGYSEGYYADLVITTADVTGGTDGIYAASEGSAYGYSELIIDSSIGSVVGEAGRGIDARQSGESEDGSTVLQITTADVSGGTDGIYAINAGSAYSFNDLEIDSTAGSVVGAAGIGIAARHEGQSSEAYSPADLVIFTANVSGGTTGIRAAHYGLAANSTAVIIDTTAGSVSGLSDTGIDAVQGGQSAYASAELSITSAEVFGATDGINAVNRGSAEYSVYLNIDSTYGSVTGQSDHGIRALQEGISRTDDADLIITTADVSGATDGINALSYGSAYGSSDLIIDSTAGSVVGEAKYGIAAANVGVSKFETTDLVINAADVRGGIIGIIARTYGSAYGSSDLIIDSTVGSVVGEAGTGIDVRNEGSSEYGTSDLVITAADVTGGTNGIRAFNEATAASSTDLFIDTTAGSVAGLFVDGIDAVQGGQSALASADLSITTAGVSGAADGIAALNRGSAEYSADLNIDTTYGSVIGEFRGITALQDAVSRKGTTDLIITTADVSGGLDGIRAENYGSAYGTSDVIIDTSAGAVLADARHGIATSNDGNSESETTNLIVKSADVRGGSAGMLVRNYGTAAGASDLMIDSSAGSVVGGTFYGIEARHFGSSLSGTSNVIITAADVTGGTQGIYANTSARAAADSVLVIDTVAGTVRGGEAAQGISAISTAQSAGGDADVRITTADVSGGTTGIEAYGRASASGDVDLAIDTVAGTVTGETYDGISVLQQGQSSDGSARLTITTADVSGAFSGIIATGVADAENAVNLEIDTSQGAVTSQYGAGINAFMQSVSRSNTADLAITTADVKGGTTGVLAFNFGTATGSANLSIDTSAGMVTGVSASGITAESRANSTAGAAMLDVTTADVSGADIGVETTQSATAVGATTLSIDTTLGTIAGQGFSGIFALQSSQSQSGDASLLLATGDVNGAGTGITAFQYGEGAQSANIVIDTSAGAVTGSASDGIYAISYAASSQGSARMVLQTGAVSGQFYGINAFHEASGAGDVDLVIDSTAGGVIGLESAGINASQRSTSETGNASLEIVTGDVSGSGVGIEAEIFSQGSATDLTITTIAGDVTGGAQSEGIAGVNFTTAGATTITTGDVRGGQSGIFAQTFASGGLFMTVAPDGSGVLGLDQSGIIAVNSGSGATQITVNSAAANAQVAGALQGIFAIHESSENFAIDVQAGMVANLDGLSTSRAITARSEQRGVELTIGEQGGVIGTLDLTASDDVVTNAGFWDPTGGVSDFGGGSDVFNNTSANTLVVGNGQANQTTQFLNLETFNNSGRIDLGDGDATGRFDISGDFNALSGSVIEMDLNIGAGTADMIVIGGDVTGGGTAIRVSSIDADGAGLTGFGRNDGLSLISVAGATSAGDFSLLQPLQQDVFLYDDLVLGTDNVWRLQSQFLPSIPAYDVYPSLLLNLGTLTTTVRQPATATRNQEGGLWLDVSRTSLRQGNQNSAIDSSYRQNFNGITLGLDVDISSSLQGTVTLHYMDSTGRIKSPHGDAAIQTEGYGVGGQLMWTGSDGAFIGMQGRMMAFESSLPTIRENDSNAKAVSIEAGKMFKTASGWNFSPYVTVNYASVDFDTFTGGFGDTVEEVDAYTLQGRVGLLADRIWKDRSTAYIGFSLDQALTDRRKVDVSVTNTYRFGRDDDVTGASITAGGRVALSGNSFLTGDLAISRGFDGIDDFLSTRANIGLQITW